MSMKGMLWAVLAPGHPTYLEWLESRIAAHPKPKGFNLQRCKYISRMLDVYNAAQGGVEVICLPGWEAQWTPGEVRAIKERLHL